MLYIYNKSIILCPGVFLISTEKYIKSKSTVIKTMREGSRTSLLYLEYDFNFDRKIYKTTLMYSD